MSSAREEVCVRQGKRTSNVINACNVGEEVVGVSLRGRVGEPRPVVTRHKSHGLSFISNFETTTNQNHIWNRF